MAQGDFAGPLRNTESDYCDRSPANYQIITAAHSRMALRRFRRNRSSGSPEKYPEFQARSPRRETTDAAKSASTKESVTENNSVPTCRSTADKTAPLPSCSTRQRGLRSQRDSSSSDPFAFHECDFTIGLFFAERRCARPRRDNQC